VALNEISSPLMHLSVSGGGLAGLEHPADLQWCGTVVVRLDAAGSACVVQLRALACSSDTADLPWLQPARAAGTGVYR